MKWEKKNLDYFQRYILDLIKLDACSSFDLNNTVFTHVTKRFPPAHDIISFLLSKFNI